MRASAQNLPTELLDYVFLYLETPQDLLHAALACKIFYKIIISTYRLHFANISCSFTQTSSKFWQKLSSTPHLCSRIRRLEISSKEIFYDRRASNIQRFHGLRIDKRFFAFAGSAWSTKTDIPATQTNFEIFLQCLDKLHRCQSITVFDDVSPRELSGLLAHVHNHLSDILQTFVVDVYCDAEYPAPVLYGALSKRSFDRLETFCLDIKSQGIFSFEILNSILDPLVFSCYTLVNFTLSLTYTLYPPTVTFLYYYSLMKYANWHFLKKFKLGGWLRLLDPQDNTTDVYFSFLERHSQLECLFLDIVEDEVEPFQSELPPHVLPQLRSVSAPFPFHPGILPRLHHISNLEVFEPEIYSSAVSLRSCVLKLASDSIIQNVITAIPHLERLCLIMYPCAQDTCPVDDCVCIFSHDPHDIKQLRNLTHFGLLADDMSPTVLNELVKDLIDHLPRLSYVYLNGRRGVPVPFRVSRDLDGHCKLIPTKESVEGDWGDDLLDRIMRKSEYY